MKRTRTPRIGLMGCGIVATYGHLPALRELADAGELDLAAVFDPVAEKAEAAGAKFKTRAFTDAEAFFSSGLDGVAIASPAPCHPQNVCDAARHGLHALCEKPLALSDRDGARMLRAMKAARRMLFTGYCYRFSPSALEIKRLIERGAIGRLCSLRLIYIWDCHGKYAKEAKGKCIIQKRREDRMLEGGPMVDCGVHQIDLARWWAGDVRRFRGVGAWADNYPAPDHVYVHLDHAGGAHTMVEISYSFGHTCRERLHQFTYQLIGDKGVIEYDRHAKRFELHDSKGTHALAWQPEKNFAGMYRAFARAIITGKGGPLPTGEDGLAAARIARLGTEEAMKGRR
jgi:predicted dehydrogenase